MITVKHLAKRKTILRFKCPFIKIFITLPSEILQGKTVQY